MGDRTCSIDGCDRSTRARGWCDRHYQRWKAHGEPDRPAKTPAERFFERLDVGDCWEWTGALSDGYGRFRPPPGDEIVRAHRWAYEHLVGPIPDGLELDHLCRNHACVNPDHLEPVLRRINNLRGISPSARNARKTHCKNGHEFAVTNTYVTPRGRRQCRTCRADSSARYQARQSG